MQVLKKLIFEKKLMVKYLTAFLFILIGVLDLDSFQARLLRNMAPMLASCLDWQVEKSYFRKRSPLVVGGTRTQFLADSMALAARVLDHYTT